MNLTEAYEKSHLNRVKKANKRLNRLCLMQIQKIEEYEKVKVAELEHTRLTSKLDLAELNSCKEKENPLAKKLEKSLVERKNRMNYDMILSKKQEAKKQKQQSQNSASKTKSNVVRPKQIDLSSSGTKKRMSSRTTARKQQSKAEQMARIDEQDLKEKIECFMINMQHYLDTQNQPSLDAHMEDNFEDTQKLTRTQWKTNLRTWYERGELSMSIRSTPDIHVEVIDEELQSTDKESTEEVAED